MKISLNFDRLCELILTHYGYPLSEVREVTIHVPVVSQGGAFGLETEDEVVMMMISADPRYTSEVSFQS